ncbi:hypothetical protein SERLA73DRAFT_178420 [Serpula lacrymans var. lacrymans S7.3]|uniref:Family A G protein-coupled receptor-like protein n=2 Tax=Serpula lacrymans var. lacrymans TaxID=341189 RepID=F8PRF5_SERL3|nr:uncharacterized protein SERLADRAFT_462848 [Serpula lacrymans var. lacrymans S7.9]EGO00578.1 hypothetical protein SERLA73DRAFT_178420 [Serpula lacrymans var. lacrymans S7.3]EGO26132.1 hypothetical protein SERLADRAFT_462848 [Serpula lacrymans var. lacrymans S7.9]
MSNDALQNNPVSGDRHITTHASDWLWAVFAVMLLSMLIAIFWHGASVKRHRYFHQIPIIVLTVSTIAYFSMASDLGYTTIPAEFGRNYGGHPTRQIWYVRYIQWFINAPLLLLGLLLLTGLSYSDILTTIFFALVLVVTGLVGALTTSSYKWGYFAFGLFSLFYLCYRLLGHSARFPFRAGAGSRTGFLVASSYLTFIWMLYPICWGLSEGGNVITPTSEMVFYGILDLFAGPIFLALFLNMLRKVEYNKLGMDTGRAVTNEKGGAGVGPGTSGTAASAAPGATAAGTNAAV